MGARHQRAFWSTSAARSSRASSALPIFLRCTGRSSSYWRKTESNHPPAPGRSSTCNHQKYSCRRSSPEPSLGPKAVMAGFAGVGGGAKGGVEAVQTSGLRSGSELDGFGLHLFGMFLELGRLGPDLGPGLGRRALVGAGTESAPRQLGKLGQQGGIVLPHLGIERHTPGGHGAQAAEMLAHHEQRALAVFDRVLGFGKLGRSRGAKGQGRSGQGQRSKGFHRNFLFRGWNESNFL